MFYRRFISSVAMVALGLMLMAPTFAAGSTNEIPKDKRNTTVSNTQVLEAAQSCGAGAGRPYLASWQ